MSVVQTKVEIIFGDYVKPIALINRLVTAGQLHTSGWGDTGPSGETPNELQWITTDVVPYDECQRLIGTLNPDTLCVYSKYLLQN